jgi:hypothetical protein
LVVLINSSETIMGLNRFKTKTLINQINLHLFNFLPLCGN